jgi:hypothetical protein
MSVSRRYAVGFRDACRILEGDDIFWDSLVMFVLYVAIVVATSICISS